MFSKKTIISIAIIASIALTILNFGMSTNRFLNTRFLDDSYYYIVIARNVLHGNGVVFSHDIPTNGFHPLYLLVVMPIVALSGNNLILPIYLISLLNIIFNLGIGFFLYKIIKKLFNDYLASITLLFWIANPFVMLTVLIGLETTLNTFFIAMTVYYILDKGLEKINHYYLGLLLSLVFLSRMDGIFFVLPVLAYYFFASEDTGKIIFKNLLKSCGTMFLFIIPYLFFNIFIAKSLFPISGMASQNLAMYTGTPLSALFFYGIKSFVYLIANFFNIFYLLMNNYTAIIFITVLLIIFSIDIFKHRLAWSMKLKPVWFLFVYSGMTLLYYVFVQKWYKDWYVFPTYIILTIIIITVLSNSMIVKTKWFIVIVLIIFISNFFVLEKYYHQNFTGVYDDVVNYTKNNIETTAVVGSFNPGRLAWRLEEYNVINLDGLVNYKAFKALKNRNVSIYFDEINLSYILDTKSTDVFFDYVKRDTIYSKNISFYNCFINKNVTVQYDIARVNHAKS